MEANAFKEKAADSATCVPEKFPVGLKVLVVDDDVICLRILEHMLRKCMYRVTTCSQATAALSLLRERKGFFDIVLSDVHMPDMDGFKLLEFVGLEMDLPVIMMSGDDRTSNVMRGIRHGACDYLIKPIRTEELQNIWQHVVRKKRNVSKGQEGNLEDDDDQRKCGHGDDDDDEDGSSVNEGSADAAVGIPCKKRKDIKEEDEGNLENDDHTMSKKQRVVWSVELHQQFVSAVNQLGIDKAVPKRILEVMNVPGLSRENVASHLQKFRLYLKRLSGVSHQQNGLPNRFGGPLDQNPKLGSFNGLDYQALASSGRISPEILAALHAEFVTSPTGIPILPLVDQSTVLQPSLTPKNTLLCQNNPYGQTFMKIPSNISHRISSAVDSADGVAHSGYGSGSSKDVNNMVGYAVEQPGNTITRLMQSQHQGEQIIGNNRVMSLMHQHQHQHQQRQPEEHRQNLPEHNHYGVSANHYGVSANHYGAFSQHSNNPSYTILDPEVSFCAFGGSSSSYYSGSVNANNNNTNNGVTLTAAQNMIGTTTYGGPFSALGYNNTIVCGSYDGTSISSKLVDNGLLPKNTSRVFGSGTLIPNRFVVDDTELPPIMGNANQGRIW